MRSEQLIFSPIKFRSIAEVVVASTQLDGQYFSSSTNICCFSETSSETACHVKKLRYLVNKEDWCERFLRLRGLNLPQWPCQHLWSFDNPKHQWAMRKSYQTPLDSIFLPRADFEDWLVNIDAEIRFGTSWVENLGEKQRDLCTLDSVQSFLQEVVVDFFKYHTEITQYQCSHNSRTHSTSSNNSNLIYFSRRHRSWAIDSGYLTAHTLA